MMKFWIFLIILFAVSALGQERTRSPENLIFFSIRKDSFGVGWAAQDRAIAYQPFVTYASNGSIPEDVKFSTTPPIQTNFVMVTGLIPGTKYNVSITSVDIVGSVEPGRNQTNITLPAQVQNLNIYAQSSDGLSLTWDPVKSATSYQLTVRNNFFQNVVEQMVDGLNFTTTQLQTGELYTIFVSAENENGKGDLGTLTSYTIAQPFESEIEFVSNTDSSITVRHKTVVGVVNYELRATRNISNTELTCTLVNQMCTFDNLLSGVNYNFSIRGIYESGSRSQFSSPVTFTTKPARPNNLTITSEDFSLNVTTDPVVGAHNYTFILNTTREQMHEQPQAEFPGLLSGQEYSFTIYATRITSYGTFLSENASVTGETTRAVPTDVRVTNVTHNQLRVTYSSISGAQSYNVRAIPLNNTLQIVTERSINRTSVVLTNLEASQPYNIDVNANYKTGSGNPSVTVQQYTAPFPPDNLTVTLVRNDSISISWIEVSAAMSYTVNYSTSTTSSDSLNTNETQANITNLDPGTVYTFTVTAFNMNLSSIASITLEQITAPATPNFLSETSTQTSISATWNQPKGAESYEVEVIQNGMSHTSPRNIFDTTNGYSSSERIEAGSYYTVCVSARTSNDTTLVGILQYSERECVEILTAPPNVQNLRIVQRLTTSLTLHFNHSQSATLYRVTWTNSSSSASMNVSSPAATLIGLSPGTMYNISVVAINDAGESGSSGMLVNEFTRSLSPDTLIFTQINTTSFVVSWTPQLQANSYFPTVVRTSNGVRPTTVSFPSTVMGEEITVTDLLPGTEYSVSVTTRDQFGLTNTGSINIQLTLPGSIQNLVVSSQSNNSITWQWNPVKSTTFYSVQVESDSGLFSFTDNVTATNNTLVTFTALNLDPAELYHFEVFANNEVGRGEADDNSDYTIAEPFPSVVSFVSNTNSSITLRHTTVAGVVSYTIRAIQNNQMFTCTSVNQQCTLNGLVSGTNCSIAVQGTYNSGSVSSYGSSEIYITKPARPENLNIIPEDFSLNITNQPVTGASFYTFYLITPGSTVIQMHDQPRAEFLQLLSGQSYLIIVSAGIVTSYGTFRSENASIQAETTRAVPTDVRVTNVTHNQLRVTYSFISGAQSYNVRAIPLNNTLQAVSETSVTGTSVFLINLEASQPYNIDVSANYKTGSGNPSVAVQQYTAPLPPVNLTVTLVRNDSISISWIEESAAMEYNVSYRSPTSLVSSNTNETRLNATNLESGTIYTFTVTAINVNIQSFPSVTLIQITAPATPNFLSKTSTQTRISATWDQPEGAESYEVEVIQNGVSSIPSRNILVAAIGYNSSDGIQAGSIYTVCISAGTSEDPTIVGIPQYSHRNCVDITTAPPNVQNLRIVQRLTTSLILHFNHSQSATSYRVTWTNSSSSASLNVSSPTATLIGLSPGTMYNISVVAINGAGESGSSGTLVNEFTRSISPDTLIFTQINTTSFVVSWTPQLQAISYVPTVVRTSYGVRPATVSFPSSVAVEEVTVTGMLPGTEYSVSVTTRDQFGLTNAGSVNIQLTLPGSIQNLVVSSQSNNSITWQWDSVKSTTFYSVQVESDSGFISFSDNVTATNNTQVTYTALNLDPAELYHFEVFANNEVGRGEADDNSDYTIAEPFSSVVSFVSNTNSSITVSHTTVAGVVSYTIRAIQNNQVFTCTSVNQQCTLNGLLSGTNCSIAVQGTYNSGSVSSYGSSEIYITKPARPENLNIIPEDFSLTITNQPVTGASFYTFYLITPGNSSLQEVNQPQAIFSQLLSGQNYSIIVSAGIVTSYGTFRSENASIQAETTRAIPTGVTVIKVTCTQFEVSWDLLSGSSSYNVMATPTNGSLQTVSLTFLNESSVTLENLEAGQSYNVSVSANFVAGPGPASEPEQLFTTPTTLPSNSNFTCPLVTRCTENQVWLCHYIRWKIQFLTIWRPKFSTWSRCSSSSAYPSVDVQCDALNVSCLNPGQRGTVTYGDCCINYCLDGCYQDVPDSSMDALRNDERSWREYSEIWNQAVSETEDVDCDSEDSCE